MGSDVRNYTVSKLFGSNWCHAIDILQTKSKEMNDNYSLKDLAVELNLAGDFISR